MVYQGISSTSMRLSLAFSRCCPLSYFPATLGFTQDADLLLGWVSYSCYRLSPFFWPRLTFQVWISSRNLDQWCKPNNCPLVVQVRSWSKLQAIVLNFDLQLAFNYVSHSKLLRSFFDPFSAAFIVKLTRGCITHFFHLKPTTLKQN